MSTILITGANRGLGHEAARRLLAEGHDVIVGARDPARGQAAADALGARFVALDVTDDERVARAAEEVGTLDVLVNNAGIPGTYGLAVGDVSAAEVAAVFDVNVLGPVRTFAAFLPLLRASPAGVVVNVSSGLGSHAVTSDPARIESSFQMPAYTSSKAALNILTAQWAAALPGLRINAVDPATPRRTSTTTRALRPSRRAPTRSSPWPSSARTARRARSSTGMGPWDGERSLARVSAHRARPREVQQRAVDDDAGRVGAGVAAVAETGVSAGRGLASVSALSRITEVRLSVTVDAATLHQLDQRAQAEGTDVTTVAADALRAATQAA